MTVVRYVLFMSVVLLTVGCGPMPYIGHIQELPVPQPSQNTAQNYPNGAIYQLGMDTSYHYHALFENQRARSVGDTLTVTITESLSSVKNLSSKLSRQGDTSAGIGNMTRIPNIGLAGLNVSAQSKHNFKGDGENNATMNFTGTITVMVNHVLPNGNLEVAGQKRIVTNDGLELLEISGIVNPTNIDSNNTVASWQLANARLSYRERGDAADYNYPGWFHRILVKLLPL